MVDLTKYGPTEAATAPMGLAAKPPRLTFPISNKTRKRLDAERCDGETDDDIIRRIGESAFSITDRHAAATSYLIDKGREFDALNAEESSAHFSKDPLDHTAKAIYESLTRKFTDDFDAEEQAEVDRIRDQLTKVSSPERRAELSAALVKTLRDIRDAKRMKRDDALRRLDQTKEKLEWFQRRDKCADELEFMNNAPEPRLQRLTETGFHKCLQAMKDGEIIWPTPDGKPVDTEDGQPLAARLAAIAPDLQTFVVEHDWASAFAKADQFEEGEFRIPYEDAVFEFRISGKRTCALVSTVDCLPFQIMVFVETSVGWVMASAYRVSDGNWNSQDLKTPDLMVPVVNLIRAQVRAICIALEAEVAESEVIRAPHKLNAKRIKAGKLPVFDYHVVQLSRRTRVAPRLPEELDPDREIHHKRLHFVRGHWRHFTNGKTWIKWHMRGDPDLGFIDKHYRL